ncbi:MAG TPA: ABC transporter ATP-binding protein [Thermoclostridium sp.]
MNKILDVLEVEKTYISKGNQYPVLKKISLSVQRGEFVAVMGPSGSGKTTLLNIISGFLSADSGSVRIGGVDILHADREKQAEIRSGVLGFVFQDFMLIDGLTVEENIMLPQIIIGKGENEIKNQTDSLMNFFGISEHARKYPDELSGGQKQRVAIARALSNQPMLVLADEPTGNLDSKSSKAVIDAFLMAKKKLNATILMVTHDAIAASFADKVIALSDGQIVRNLVREEEPREFMNRILEFLKEVEAGK